MRDWPGMVSATLLLSGCSLHCPYCQDARLLRSAAEPPEWDSILEHLDANRGWLDGVVVTGGEPTEDPDLPSLLAALAEVDVPVRLDTNGMRPDVLSLVVAEELVSFVAMDIKSVPSGYRALSARGDAAPLVARSTEILIRSGIEHEFRTTVYPGCVTLADLPRIARALKGGRLYALQQFRPSRTLDPAAEAVTPFAASDLRSAATACSTYLSTIVRGLRSGEAA